MILHDHADGGVCFWCPGCDEAHCVGTLWTIDHATATLQPSVLVNGTQWATDAHFHKSQHANVPPGGQTVCHSFVTSGRIQFLADSTHALAGQTVDLPEWPIA